MVLIYCAAGTVICALGIIAFHLHWLWAFVGAATGAGTLVLIASDTISSWRRCGEIRAALRDGLTCTGLREKSREIEQMTEDAGKLQQRSRALGVGVWWLLIVPSTIATWMLLSQSAVAVLIGVASASVLAILIPRAVTWLERRAVAALSRAVADARLAHDWDGCTCRICAEVRDTGHSWDGCRCLRCGTSRDQGHDWGGCKCRRCGASRDEEHQWEHCICAKCGRTSDQNHRWRGCKCAICHATRDEQHRWSKSVGTSTGGICLVCGRRRPSYCPCGAKVEAIPGQPFNCKTCDAHYPEWQPPSYWLASMARGGADGRDVESRSYVSQMLNESEEVQAAVLGLDHALWEWEAAYRGGSADVMRKNEREVQTAEGRIIRFGGEDLWFKACMAMPPHLRHVASSHFDTRGRYGG